MKDPTTLRGYARRNWLRGAARRVKWHPRARADQVVSLGVLLLQVKAVVGWGKFRPWLAAHWPHSYRIAAEAMRAARMLAAQKCAVRNFGPSAVRVLVNGAMPKSRRERPLASPGGDKLIGALGALFRTLDRDEAPAEPEDAAAADVSDEERAYLQLAELVGKCAMVHFTIDRDPEAPSVSIHAYFEGGGCQDTMRSSLAGALAAATGQEPQRRCPKCRIIWPGHAFAKSTSRCRICERERVKDWEERRRAKARPG